MSQQIFALSFGLAAALAATQIAQGAPRCDSRAGVTARLADRSGETRQAFGRVIRPGVTGPEDRTPAP